MDKNNQLTTDLDPKDELIPKLRYDKEKKITTKETLKEIIDYVEET